MILFRKKSDGVWQNDRQKNDILVAQIVAQFGGSAGDYEGFAVPSAQIDAAMLADIRYIDYTAGVFTFPKVVRPMLSVTVKDSSNNVVTKNPRGHRLLTSGASYSFLIQKIDPSTGLVVNSNDTFRVMPLVLIEDVVMPNALVNGAAQFNWPTPADSHGCVEIFFISKFSDEAAAKLMILNEE